MQGHGGGVYKSTNGGADLERHQQRANHYRG